MDAASSAVEHALLTGDVDMFSCVTIHSNCLPADAAVFQASLERSLVEWKRLGRRGIWLSVPHSMTQLLPVAIGLGFELHHAQKTHVMLCLWIALPPEPNKLPSYATSTVGVGGMVLNQRNEVLLVVEKYNYVRGKEIWKLPGGLADRGEAIEDAAVREVLEETGIRTEFKGVLGFTFKEQFRFGHSDVYFICLLSLPRSAEGEDEQATRITIDPGEIAKCEWKGVADWAACTGGLPIIGEIVKLAQGVVAGTQPMFSMKQLMLEVSPGKNWTSKLFSAASGGSITPSQPCASHDA